MASDPREELYAVRFTKTLGSAEVWCRSKTSPSTARARTVPGRDVAEGVLDGDLRLQATMGPPARFAGLNGAT
jgi:hypothetical protein